MTSPAVAVIGIDTGGTFIDFALRAPDGRLHFHKELADTGDLPASVIRGIDALARGLGLTAAALLGQTALIAHGTTLATNAILTRTGAPAVLVTTEGLRDALEMRRGVKEQVYDLRYVAPRPLISRQHRHGVTERIGAQGEVLLPLATDSALQATQASIQAAEAAGAPVQSIAVCLMHAWINPAHEADLTAELRARWPHLDVVCSHQILPQAGFYDRVSTTVTTAYTAPIIRTYLDTLDAGLRNAGFTGALFIVTSAGGLMTPRDAIAQSARTVLSGPAAAPVFGARFCQATGASEAIVVDMGGTSFDISLVMDGAPVYAPGGEIDGLRVAFPITDVRTIALGGGSIAWIDAGGLLRLGPHSAGANPGSASFGRGGTEPTITDADVVLGLLDADSFGRSGMRLLPELARRALTDRLGGDAHAMATGVYRLAATQMADAVIRASLDVGLDYRLAPLVVGGGAGPLHGCAIGREIGAATIIIPASAATLCAVGALFLRPRYDVVRSVFTLLDDATPTMVKTVCDALTENLMSAVPAEETDVELRFVADLRYVGQNGHISTPFEPADIAQAGIPTLRTAFEALHQQRRGHSLAGEPVEMIAIRLAGSWNTVAATPSTLASHGVDASPRRSRMAYDASTETMREFAVHAWETLQPGQLIAGPALIEMVGTTCVLIDPYQVQVDADRNLILTLIS